MVEVDNFYLQNNPGSRKPEQLNIQIKFGQFFHFIFSNENMKNQKFNRKKIIYRSASNRHPLLVI